MVKDPYMCDTIPKSPPPPTIAWISSHACVKPYLIPFLPLCVSRTVQGFAGLSRLLPSCPVVLSIPWCPAYQHCTVFCRTGTAQCFAGPAQHSVLPDRHGTGFCRTGMTPCALIQARWIEEGRGWDNQSDIISSVVNTAETERGEGGGGWQENRLLC